jgi:hypothetical protein
MRLRKSEINTGRQSDTNTERQTEVETKGMKGRDSPFNMVMSPYGSATDSWARFTQQTYPLSRG